MAQRITYAQDNVLLRAEVARLQELNQAQERAMARLRFAASETSDDASEGESRPHSSEEDDADEDPCRDMRNERDQLERDNTRMAARIRKLQGANQEMRQDKREQYRALQERDRFIEQIDENLEHILRDTSESDDAAEEDSSDKDSPEEDSSEEDDADDDHCREVIDERDGLLTERAQ
jgi:hypothetical protein